MVRLFLQRSRTTKILLYQTLKNTIFDIFLYFGIVGLRNYFLSLTLLYKLQTLLGHNHILECKRFEELILLLINKSILYKICSLSGFSFDYLLDMLLQKLLILNQFEAKALVK